MYNHSKGVIILSSKRPDHVNLSIKPEIVDEFYKYSGRLGIKLSPWVAAKMKEFIEEQKELEELRKNKK
jgi:hypothetical protein